MKRIVIKFGGTSMLDCDRIGRVAAIVAAVSTNGPGAEACEVVVVVSAMGHTTDHLLELAGDVSAGAAARELDVLVSTGEQVSAALLAIALQKLGLAAQSFNGAQAGIVTDSHFGQARIKHVHTEALESALQAGIIPVVAGFQGLSTEGQVTTLGRGGSDTTAIALAACLHAERCDIYSDVNGVFSADPRLLPDAYKLPTITYKEMLELAQNGAQILNARSVEMAQRQSVAVRVRSTFEPADEGTLVQEESRHAGSFAGVACLNNQCHVRLDYGDESRDARMRCQAWKKHVLAIFAAADLSIEICSPLRPTGGQLHFCLSQGDLNAALDLLSADLYRAPTVVKDLAKVSVVARDLHSSLEVDAIVALTLAKIPILLTHSSQHRISFYIHTEHGQKAIDLLHCKFAPLKIAA